MAPNARDLETGRSREDSEKESAGESEFRCDDCGQSSKNVQGLAGHRRLAHSTSTARELDERQRALAQRTQAATEKERAAREREAEARRGAEATRLKEAELARREKTVQEAESTPEAKRLLKVVRAEIQSLPEVSTETILRVNGTDYRISDAGELVHLYWPEGEKTEFQVGERFQYGGRAYCIRGGKLEAVRSSTLLAKVLGEED